VFSFDAENRRIRSLAVADFFVISAERKPIAIALQVLL
jgi:hypothetical protein